ncbi:hypothetical protein COCOBI_03-2690 [Coccomyxa sp. Obi]|nr:hypothetical protein COCOBI_03-2690 [Coccomyxa sp. Obi]
MWRFFGGVFQPVLGTANYLLSPIKPLHKPVILPSGFEPVPATPLKELEVTLQALDAKKEEWANLTTLKRAELLRETLKSVIEVSKEAGEAATAAKGSYGTGIGEEWMAWLPVAWAIRELIEAMDAGGQPTPNAVRQRPDGQVVVDVFPLGIESLFFGGMKGEVWIQPGKPASQGANYRAKARGKKLEGEVALVLGAGNQTPVACMDILHKLFIDDAVVVCKMNPVNEYLGKFIRLAYAPLVQAGYVEIVYGGAKEGAFLTNHPIVKSIHLTGSSATYDAVVWGGQKKVGEPPLKKEVGAELGCVTPYIITPGAWTQDDIEYYADEIVAGLVHNAGHNCTKAEILITDKDWPQREALVQAIRARLDREPRRVAWYPGSEKRAAAFKAAIPGVEELGAIVEDDQQSAAPSSYMPWLFKAGLSPEQARTDTENWCGVLQEVALPGTGADPETFLDAAVAYANDRCWGSLSCSLMVPPDVSAAHADAVDRAVAALRYGSININVVTILGFCVSKLTWGAYPGNTPQDIGSGNCMVHNTLLLDHPQKSVLWGPWRYYPTHLWSPSNRNLEAAVPAAIYFLSYPSIITLIPPALAALRG